MSYRILAINPGSTSTKVAVYDEEKEIFSKNIDHSIEELNKFAELIEQFDYRKDIIKKILDESDIDIHTLSAVVGRGGIVRNLTTGGYIVNEKMKNELTNNPIFLHASNLGGLIAYSFAKPLGIPAYIYDAVTSNELLPIAKITGFKEVERESFCHVLNSRAISIKLAKSHGKNYEDMNYVVAHMGGGISISAHDHGRIIDSVSDDAGPFSPERSGSLNLIYVVDMCYSGKYTKKEMLKKIRGEGGLKSLLGTTDCREIEKRILNGDEYAKLVYEAEALQVAKGIGIMLACFEEKIDAVILTGGMAYSTMLTDLIKKRIDRLVPIEVVAGENEMEALALGTLRMLKGEEKVKELI
jgi:butyrate kinase